jgi:acyl dehydratase
MDARFSKPVMPGDTLTVSMWVDGNQAIFQTATQNGEVVIDNGLCTFS